MEIETWDKMEVFLRLLPITTFTCNFCVAPPCLLPFAVLPELFSCNKALLKCLHAIVSLYCLVKSKGLTVAIPIFKSIFPI